MRASPSSGRGRVDVSPRWTVIAGAYLERSGEGRPNGVALAKSPNEPDD